MKIPGDIAGATFMAAGSSMPTLFICIISLFLGEGAIGLGTIIGSTLFNILFITAASSLLAVDVLHLHRWPLLRDSFAYSLHLVALLIIIADSKVHWYEGMSILLLYGIYIATLVYDIELHESINTIKKVIFGNDDMTEPESNKTKPLLNQNDHLGKNRPDDESETSLNRTSNEDVTYRLEDQYNTTSERNLEAVQRIIQKDQEKYSNTIQRYESVLSTFERKGDTIPQGEENTIETRNDSLCSDDKGNMKSECIEINPFSFPSGWAKRIFWVFLLPIRLLFFFTMPDVRKERWQNWYPATFLISIIWMAVISYVLVWAVAIIGETLRFPEALMGLFLLAAGSSVPDAIASVVVARRGDGDMAIASCVGSNIFDIVCLAIPWIVATSIVHPNSVVLIEGEHMVFTSLTLFGSILSCVLIIHINKWRLTKKTGITFIIVYIIFMIICGAIELIPFHCSISNTSLKNANSSGHNKNYTNSTVVD